MDRIICLVGESGSGKSTVAELLGKSGCNYIQSYTTRAPRFHGEKGHIFVESILDSDDFDVCDSTYYLKENVIAYTYFDNAHYWATKEQYKGKGNSVYVIDPAGIKELREHVQDAEIVVIYLKVAEEERICRMCERGTESVFNRIKHDREAFKVVPCNYTIDANRPVAEVMKNIRTILCSL